MTKYILDGGGMRQYQDEGVALFGEFVAGLGHSPKILMCFFGEEEEVWADKYDEWTRRIVNSVKPVSPVFSLASVADFVSQAALHDALFIYGGRNSRMKHAFSRVDVSVVFPTFKAVLGSSAGAIFLADVSWSCDEREMLDGSGLLPVKTIVHYQSERYDQDPRGPIDWQKAYQECEHYGKELPIHALREASYTVVTQ